MSKTYRRSPGEDLLDELLGNYGGEKSKGPKKSYSRIHKKARKSTKGKQYKISSPSK